MWEFCLVLDGEAKGYDDYFISKLKRFNSIIVVARRDNCGSCEISIACDSAYKPKFATILKRTIAEFIILVYKERFYSRNLHITGMAQNYIKALTKALYLFDAQDDIDIILKALKLKDKLYLSTFYTFRLQALRAKWEAIIDLYTSSSYYFVNTKVFVEVLKFLVECLPHKYDSISIVYRGEEYVLLEDGYHPIDPASLPESLNTEIGMLVNLIYLAPKEINVMCMDNISHSTFSIIYNIFNQTINLSF